MAETRECLGCGKPISVPPSRAARGAGMTCSMACRLETYGFGARIRAAMPATMSSIAEQARVEVEVVRANVKRLLRAGTAHVSGFHDRGLDAGRGVPRFECIISLGPQTDPEMPVSTRDAVTLHTKRLVLSAMPGRAQAIVHKLGMTTSSVSRMLQQLHADEQCHITGWYRPAKGAPLPIFTAGPGKDKPCRIKSFTGAEKSRRYVAKLKKSGEWDRRASKVRSYYWKNKAASQGDTLVSALFGRASSKQKPNNGATPVQSD